MSIVMDKNGVFSSWDFPQQIVQLAHDAALAQW
jgi:hypothetical protein